MRSAAPVFALLAEFRGPSELLDASRRTRDAGYTIIEAYSPYPVEGLVEALGHKHRNRLPLLVLIGGLVGGATGILMQWYASAIDYPLNIGGRPLFSWPSFIPITFEMTVLVAAATAVLSMIGLNGLPRPYHPMFNVPAFARASQDRFFLAVSAEDPKFDRGETRRFLEGLEPVEVNDVEP